MGPKTLNNTFAPHTLADDFLEVRRIYAEFFASLDETRWDSPVKSGPKEWTLHETIPHLCALTGKLRRRELALIPLSTKPFAKRLHPDLSYLDCNTFCNTEVSPVERGCDV